MSESNIDRALELAAANALFMTNAGALGNERIAMEGFPFTPPKDGAWAQLKNLPAGADVASLGNNGMDEHVGVYQIDVNVPEVGGNPRAVLLEYADDLRRHFVAGRLFSHGCQNVRVRSASRSDIRRVDGWQRVSVSVTYSAFSIRPNT